MERFIFVRKDYDAPSLPIIFNTDEEYHNILVEECLKKIGSSPAIDVDILDYFLRDVKTFIYDFLNKSEVVSKTIDKEDLDMLLKIATEQMRQRKKPSLIKVNWEKLEEKIKTSEPIFSSLEDAMEEIRGQNYNNDSN